MKKLICVLAGLACAFAAAREVRADIILFASTGGANSSGGGRVYQIDPVSQSVTLVGDTGLSKLGALDFNSGGILYAADGGSAGPSSLYTINTSDAMPTLLGLISPGINGVDGLAFDPIGTLFGAASDGSVGRMITIDPSNGNVLTNIAMSGSGNSVVAGLAFDPTGQLFGSRGNAFLRAEDLVQIDTATGMHTPIGSLTSVISDIWFAPDGTLYAGSPSGSLFTIDPMTGDKTFVFDTGIRISGLTGVLQPSVVPEPTSIALFGIGGVGLLIGVRFRRCSTSSPL